MNKREDTWYLNDWDSIRLLNYYRDLEEEKWWINRHIKKRIAKILEEPERKIDIIMHQSFLWKVREDDESYTLWLVVLEKSLKSFWYFKQENKWGLRINNRDIIYQKWTHIIILDLQTWEIKTWVLIERVWGLMSDERRQEIKNRYWVEFWWKYIFFTQIWDLYDNYILKYTWNYHTQRLQNKATVKKFLLHTSAL